MDSALLVKQFGEDAGSAFLEIIKSVGRPIGAIEIKKELTSAGVRKADLDRKWKQLQPHIRLHPNIDLDKNKYEWRLTPGSSKRSLERLSANSLKSVPAWLTQALVESVQDSLAAEETSGDRARSSWTHQRELEKATLVADLAVSVEVMRADGATISDVADWLDGEARRKRLRVIAAPGDTVSFNPELHETDGHARVAAGAEVRVVRTGYVWHGGLGPEVLAKALVAT
ncbi:hypothetical protein ACIA8K_33105 [Catenuloplanes sp. NPDC051500]|uniref:hypothetical protein n=1 Tax=Catenuloplanes sp. NPDC051500 TaxID=3363959 RepID=UPI0037999939